MMKKQFKKWGKTKCLTFKRWGGKNFSLFAALNKVVRISVLSIAYLVSVPVLTFAMVEPDTTAVKMEYDLDEIEVSASRAPVMYSDLARVFKVINSSEIERVPVTNIADLLEYVVSVDLRQRGAEGVQADLSIRGGTFNQTLILLNGINITDPQTGHHNLNIPVSLSQIERIEVLEGPAARVYGPNAFSGAINIITKKTGQGILSARVDAGSYGFFNSNISGSFKTGKVNHLLAVNRKRADGYIDNTDFGVSNLFYSSEYFSKIGKVFFQTGAVDKEYGANSFYTPVYPEQYEKVKTYFSSVKWNTNTKINLTPAIYWRRHYDKFMLFRNDSPEWYKNHNYHKTDVYGVNINSWILWGGGKTAFGAEYRNEKILSNVLGEERINPVKVKGEQAFYTKSKKRSITSVFLEHSWYKNNIAISTGIMGNYISDNHDGYSLFPGIDFSWQFMPAIKFIASWNTSMRMPSFTDLYYNGPSNIGNPKLKPEKLQTLEGGLKINCKYLDGNVIAFYNRGKNTIDWIKENENDELWKAENHTKIISRGSEINLKYFVKNHLGKYWPQKISVDYLFNQQKKNQGKLVSNYALDYLKHKLVVKINYSIVKNISLDLNAIYQEREGAYQKYIINDGKANFRETSYLPYWTFDSKLSYCNKNWNFYISANNIFDKKYYDLGNVVQPGRWIKTGILYNLKFN